MTAVDSSKEGIKSISPSQLSTRWLTVLLAGLIMCGNHYARDAVGALENQIETDLSITSQEYATINSVYFIPSVFSPILAGLFTNSIGGAESLMLYSVICSSIGHIIFSLGIQYNNVTLMYIGRSIAGFMYETIDLVPIVILAPLFDSNWGTIVGLLNGFLRLGSVMNFVISPMIYKMRGVKAALWFATAAATSTILFAILIYVQNKDFGRKAGGSNPYEQLNISEKSAYETASETDCESRGPLSLRSIGSIDIPSHSDMPASPLSKIWDSSSSLFPEIIEKNTSDYLVAIDERALTDDGDTKVNFTVKTPLTIIARANTITEFLAKEMPLHLFGYQYYMFLLSGAFLYGSMVPFWFLGSKFLQDSYSLSVGQADALMLFPEGMIAVVAVPVGALLDRYKCTTKSRLQMLSLSCLLLPLAYVILAEGYYITSDSAKNPLDAVGEVIVQRSTHVLIPPALTMTVIGIAYAVSNSLYWGTIMDLLPSGHIASANGLIGSCLNILPSVVPPILVIASNLSVFQGNAFPSFPLYFLSFLGVFASGFALLATLNSKPSPAHLATEMSAMTDIYD